MEIQKDMRVVVRSDLDVENMRDLERCSFIRAMDKTLGQKGTVVSATFTGNYVVDFDDKSLNRGGSACYWVYRAEWLLPYSNEVTIMEED